MPWQCYQLFQLCLFKYIDEHSALNSRLVFVSRYMRLLQKFCSTFLPPADILYFFSKCHIDYHFACLIHSKIVNEFLDCNLDLLVVPYANV